MCLESSQTQARFCMRKARSRSAARPHGSALLCSVRVRASARSHTRSKCGQRQPKQHAITYRAKHALPNLAYSLSVWDTHVRPRSIWNCPNLNPGRWLMKLGQWVWLSIETEKSLTWRPEIEKWMKWVFFKFRTSPFQWNHIATCWAATFNRFSSSSSEGARTTASTSSAYSYLHKHLTC